MLTIYTQPGCGRCHVLKAKMDMKGIEYTECQEADVLRGKGVTTLPALEVDGKLLTFEEAIKLVNER